MFAAQTGFIKAKPGFTTPYSGSEETGKSMLKREREATSEAKSFQVLHARHNFFKTGKGVTACPYIPAMHLKFSSFWKSNLRSTEKIC